uniref:Uncharacterized protein n=1 Tax=Anguilla anguilla TaxID=7936 RepID=A0A0E9RNH0_ANGAN
MRQRRLCESLTGYNQICV